MSDKDLSVTITRIDTNVRWIIKVGGPIVALLFALGGYLYLNDVEHTLGIGEAKAAIHQITEQINAK